MTAQDAHARLQQLARGEGRGDLVDCMQEIHLWAELALEAISKNDQETAIVYLGVVMRLCKGSG